MAVEFEVAYAVDCNDPPKVLELFLVTSESEVVDVIAMAGDETELAVEVTGPVVDETELEAVLV